MLEKNDKQRVHSFVRGRCFFIKIFRLYWKEFSENLPENLAESLGIFPAIGLTKPLDLVYNEEVLALVTQLDRVRPS